MDNKNSKLNNVPKKEKDDSELEQFIKKLEQRNQVLQEGIKTLEDSKSKIKKS